MSAAVCGSKRSYFFDDVPASPPVSKKLRCGSSSPPPDRLSPRRGSLLDQLRSIFPSAEPEVLERALEECRYDLESAVKNLREVATGPAEEHSPDEDGANPVGGSEGAGLGSNPVDGAQWVDLFVRELMGVTTIDDAKSRVARMLESLEKSISSCNAEAAGAAMEGVQKENLVLKEQMQLVLQENGILKRAVAIQHERQKGFEEKDRELNHLRQMVSQYEERVRTLEMNNYALSMHLRQAQQSNPIPGRFNPDVF